MTLWEQCKQAATNVCFRREPNVDDPWRMLAAAVVMQGLLDDCRYGDRMDENVYQMYADAIGIDCDYVSLLQSFVVRGRYNYQRGATAWLDAALKKGW